MVAVVLIDAFSELVCGHKIYQLGKNLPFGELMEEPGGGKKAEDGVLRRLIEDLERRLIGEAMEKSGDHQSHAASLLGVSERMLRYKLKKYGLKAG